MSSVIKYAVICFSVIIVIILTGVYVWNSDPEIKAEGKAQIQNQPEETSDQYKMYFSFDGDQSQIIDLMKGKSNLNLVYSGKSKFIAKLLNSDGTLLATLADVNGPYNQKQEIDVPETGKYLLDVRTSGEWYLSRE